HRTGRKRPTRRRTLTTSLSRPPKMILRSAKNRSEPKGGDQSRRKRARIPRRRKRAEQRSKPKGSDHSRRIRAKILRRRRRKRAEQRSKPKGSDHSRRKKKLPSKLEYTNG